MSMEDRWREQIESGALEGIDLLMEVRPRELEGQGGQTFRRAPTKSGAQRISIGRTCSALSELEGRH
jgi:hypothetical protein